MNKVFKKGNLIGYLQVTQVERGANYKWINVLALLTDTGQWLTSAYWRSNAWRKAEKDLRSWGWSNE